MLRRYGVVFRRLTLREPSLPPWRDLVRVYRRLEARGEIRGGRFVDAMSGEQYALPEAVGLLREVRREEKTGCLIAVSGADPLNLAGIITPGERVPALTSYRILYPDGQPIATLQGKAVRFATAPDPANAWEVTKSPDSATKRRKENGLKSPIFHRHLRFVTIAPAPIRRWRALDPEYLYLDTLNGNWRAFSGMIGIAPCADSGGCQTDPCQSAGHADRRARTAHSAPGPGSTPKLSIQASNPAAARGGQK